MEITSDLYSLNFTGTLMELLFQIVCCADNSVRSIDILLGLNQYLFKKVCQEYKKNTEIQPTELIMLFLGRGYNTRTLYSYVHKHKWKDGSNIDADKTHTQIYKRKKYISNFYFFIFLSIKKQKKL